MPRCPSRAGLGRSPGTKPCTARRTGPTRPCPGRTRPTCRAERCLPPGRTSASSSSSAPCRTTETVRAMPCCFPFPSSAHEAETAAEGARIAHRRRAGLGTLGQRRGERLDGAIAERRPLLDPAGQDLLVARALPRELHERLRPSTRPLAVPELGVREQTEEQVAVAPSGRGKLTEEGLVDRGLHDHVERHDRFPPVVGHERPLAELPEALPGGVLLPDAALVLPESEAGVVIGELGRPIRDARHPP